MRRKQLTMQDVINALLILGFGHRYLTSKLGINDFNLVSKHFEEIKGEAKKKWKEKAFELHPDRNNGDDSKFKELSNAFELVNKVQLQPPRPVQRIIIYQTGYTAATTSYTTTSTGWF